jgi:hypothetical protein
MTQQQIDISLEALNQMALSIGKESIFTMFKKFEAMIPDENYRAIALAEIKADIAKAMTDGIKQAEEELAKYMDKPEFLEKLKKIEPES